MAVGSNDNDIVGLAVSLGGSVRLVMTICEVKGLVNGKTVDGGCGEEECSSEEAKGDGCHAHSTELRRNQCQKLGFTAL